MGLTAFVFPGQGSQAVGMGKDLAAARPEARTWFQLADQILGRDLSRVIFDGPEEALKETSNTQPALYVTSLAFLQCLKAEGAPAPAFVAGHSLGEYCALAAAGAFSAEDGLRLVRARAEAMGKAALASPGAMAAILKLADAEVEDACREASSLGLVQPANYNCPGQLVVSGSPAGVDKAVELCKARGGKALPLAVSGAFHSEAMRPAGEELRAALEAVPWSRSAVPVVANVDAQGSTDPAAFRAKLVAQLSGAVRWTQSVEKLKALGVTRYVEVGPGRVLAGLIRKIDAAAEVLNVNDLASLSAATAALRS